MPVYEVPGLPLPCLYRVAWFYWDIELWTLTGPLEMGFLRGIPSCPVFCMISAFWATWPSKFFMYCCYCCCTWKLTSFWVMNFYYPLAPLLWFILFINNPLKFKYYIFSKRLPNLKHQLIIWIFECIEPFSYLIHFVIFENLNFLRFY